MNNLVGLKINKKYGILEAQECEFVPNVNNLFEIKAPVGAGKSSVMDLCTAPPTGKDSLKTKVRLEDELDIERQLTYKEQPIFLSIKKKAGVSDVTSHLYIKDANGKRVENPMIDGVKATPASFLNKLNTDLTFGVDKFLSKDQKTHFEFMCGKIVAGKYIRGVYSSKLEQIGIILDKNSELYKGSILDRLEQARLERQLKFQEKRRLNAFKTSLEEEGYDEMNIPEWVDLEEVRTSISKLETSKYALENEIRAIDEQNTKAWYDSKKLADDKHTQDVNMLKTESVNYMSVINTYNSGLVREGELRESKLKNEIESFNTQQDNISKRNEDAKMHIDKLSEYGYSSKDLMDWFFSLDKPKDRRVFSTEVESLPVLNKVPLEDGKVLPTAYSQSYTEEVNAALQGLKVLREKFIQLGSVIYDPEPIKLATDGTGEHPVQIRLADCINSIQQLQELIEKSKDTNKIAERWIAFKEHAEADSNVNKLYYEYKSMFASLDLGIKGMTMDLIGEEGKEELVTMYDGSHNPELFHNENLEPRILNIEYSETQKTIIAILMQAYLLKEKKAKGEEGLDMMWIESPLDNKTRDLLIELQKEFGLILIANTTGDYEEVREGMFTIKGGELLIK